MKKLLFLNIFFFSFCLMTSAQLIYNRGDKALNVTKDKILFFKENTNTVFYYDIATNRIIKRYNLKYEFLSDPVFNPFNEGIKQIKVRLGFSPTNEVFYILNTFEDTNYTTKKCKPYKIIKYFNDGAGDSGWYYRKTMTRSTLSFYSTKNGNYLFSIEDTCFYQPNTLIGPASVRWNYDTSTRVPCYIDEVNFAKNSSNLIFVSIFKGFKNNFYNEDGRYSCWNLLTRKKITDTLTEIEFSKYRNKLQNSSNNNYNQYPYKASLYSNDSSIALKYLSDSTAQFFEPKTFKVIKEIIFEKETTYQGSIHIKAFDKIYFSKSKNKLLIEDEFADLYAIYDIRKNEIIRLKDIKMKE